MSRPQRILVIKLGALGDIVQAMGPAAAIRRHHPEAEIVLLTSRPYAAFLAAAPYFDAIWIDERPGLRNPLGVWRLRRRLRAGCFDRVYDLQTSDRSSHYHFLMGPGPRPEWSGIARGASHPHDNPARDHMHTLERQAEQLARAGIKSVPVPDLGWAAADVSRFGLPARFALLVPGGAEHRPDKRWPVANYAALAKDLAARGIAPVILGGPGERALGAAIKSACPATVDLTGATTLAEVAGLGCRALWAVGNDTGPMHLLAAAGAPLTVLYSADSDPALTAPRGPRVTVVRRPRLADLTLAEVAATLAIG